MKITENLKENYSSDVLLLSLICFCVGFVAGLLVAPVKNGIAIGSYNGCNNSATNRTKEI